MYKVTTSDVAHYWKCGEPAANSGANFWTDGNKLYSYRLCIGDTSAQGEKILRDYSANGRHGFQSMTTSKHIGYARSYADLVD
jgi:hypothetical protein